MTYNNGECWRTTKVTRVTRDIRGLRKVLFSKVSRSHLHLQMNRSLIHSVGQSINHLLSNLPHDLNFNHKYKKKKGQEKNDFK